MSDSDVADTEQSERRNHHHYFGNGEVEVVPREITHVTVDSSTQKIQSESFFQCHHLCRVDFSHVSSLDTVGQWAFYECRSLCEMILPPSLVHIGSYAYYECSGLADVELPHGLEVISASAFSCCRSLTKVAIPSTVQELRFGTFSHCHCLESVELPSELESIAREAFGSCWSLKNIAIPKDTRVASNAFRSCSALLTACRLGKEEALDNTSTRQNNDIIVDLLKQRFLNHPLHSLCYHHFKTSGSEPATQASEVLMQNTVERDILGMTPLHILSISAKPNWKYIQAALQIEGGTDLLLDVKDSWENTAFDYIVQNRNIDSVAWKKIVANLFRKQILLLGLEKWRREILQVVEELNASCVDERNQSFHDIERQLKAYERKEKSSLLELCLWKREICMTTSGDESCRTACRFTCYAEVVIPNVFRFLVRFD